VDPELLANELAGATLDFLGDAFPAALAHLSLLRTPFRTGIERQRVSTNPLLPKGLDDIALFNFVEAFDDDATFVSRLNLTHIFLEAREVMRPVVTTCPSAPHAPHRFE
jgi:hypothetical protein